MKEYIEREALPKKKERGFFPDDDFNAGWNACLNAIAPIPAADVAPVRHGHLVRPNPYGECSVCGMLIDIRDGFNFCPNCGADMMEEN